MDGSGTPIIGEAQIEPELMPIAALCSGRVRYLSEGGRRYIFMGGLRFLVGGVPKEMDALLCLNHPNGSYPTRLYLAQNVGHNMNWNETTYLLGKHWHTWSWNNVPPTDEPVAILAEHLRAFQ